MVEALVPRRLGSGFRWLWSASSAGNVADGILLAAAPLLVARLTDDAFPVALAVFLQRLPWLLFSLLAGALIDRVDRLRLTVAVYGMRAATVGLLAVAVAADRASLAAVYAVTFLLGTAETVADNASNALVPEVVPDRGLGLANARLVASQMVANQLVGPPVGAFLFSIGLVLPFGAYAVAMAAGAVLLTRTTRLAHRHVPPERRGSGSSGRAGRVSSRYSTIASDWVSVSPSITSTGTRPIGFRARCPAARCSPATRSTEIRRYAMPFNASAMRTR